MLFDAGGDGEDVGVDDEVFRGEPEFVDQNAVGATRDLDAALDGVGLALFVEGHDHDCGPVAPNLAGLGAEFVFAFLE